MQVWRARSDQPELEIVFWRGADEVSELHLAEDDDQIEVALCVRTLRGRTASGATAASAAFAVADGLAVRLKSPVGNRVLFDVADGRRRVSAAVQGTGAEDASLISVLDAGVPLWENPSA
jgi:hypothetical protein